MRGKAYVAPKAPAPDIVNDIDFDVAQKIKFRADKALWAEGPGPFPIRLFHVDKFNPLPVRINLLSGGKAQQFIYSAADFDYGDTGLAAKLPPDLGFSGFRVMDGTRAEYRLARLPGRQLFPQLRAGQPIWRIGARHRRRYRRATKEEFPRFVEFWLAEPEPNQPASRSMPCSTGRAFPAPTSSSPRSRPAPSSISSAELFIRNDIAQLGIAPLTSMYWYGENDKQYATDWRPEIHDSDGLALWTGKGERIWRPLIDPPSVLANSFVDENPKGFGLMQRDRKFADYQDDGAFYNRRPSMWVEPKGNWGAGAVQLVEIPDPRRNPRQYRRLLDSQNDLSSPAIISLSLPAVLAKRQSLSADQMSAASLRHASAAAACPGKPAPRTRTAGNSSSILSAGLWRKWRPRFDVTPVVTTSRGKVGKAYVVKVVGTDRWRALFDVDAPGKEQINLRCYLRLGEQTLTETWLYQYFPPA